MELADFVLLADSPKLGVTRTLSDLTALGVQVKIITGDHQLVAQHVARAVGLDASAILTGA
jgi:Mg2+-importing ATPase